nr:phage tail length tape measure family protein [Brucella anthropi]
MAVNTNNDDLLISIATDTSEMVNAGKNAARQVNSALATIEKAAIQAGNKIDNAFIDAGKGMEKGVAGGAAKSNAALKSLNTALAQQQRELAKVKTLYPQAEQAVTRYEAAVNSLKTSFVSGNATARQFQQGLERERQALLVNTTEMRRNQNAILARNKAAATPVPRVQTPANSNIAGGQSFHTANIAAQFQDIAVTAAMGMNPLQIALQQGTQLSSVLTTLGTGRQVVAGLASAFASLVSPVSLVTIGLVAGSVALVQYLASGSKTKDLTKVFQQHAESIAAIKEQYGDAANYIQLFTPESRQSQIRALKEQREELYEAVSGQAVKTASFGAGLLTDLAPLFRDAPAAAKQMRDAFANLNASIADGKPDLLAFREVMAKIANDTSVPAAIRENAEWIRKMDDEAVKANRAIPGLSASISLLGDSAGNNAAKMKILTDRLKEYSDAMKDLKGLATPELTEEDRVLKEYQRARTAAGDLIEVQAAEKLYQDAMNRINGQYIINSDGNRTRVPVPTARPLYELEGTPGEEKANKKAETAAEKARKAYKELVSSISNRNDLLRQEIDLQGQATSATEAARVALETLQKAQKAGVTGDNLENIKKQVALYQQLADTLAKTKLTQDLSRQTYMASLSSDDQRVAQMLQQYGLPTNLGSQQASQIRSFYSDQDDREAITSFLTDFKGGLVSSGGDIGKSFANAFSSALLNQADKLWDNVFRMIANAIVGGGSQPATAGASALGLGAGTISRLTSATSVANQPMASAVGSTASKALLSGTPLAFVGNYKSGVDNRLTDILQTAAQRSPGFKVDAISGLRPGDKRFHGQGLATDVRLTDLASGKMLGNYQDASSFRSYEQFAQTARQVQMEKYPELAGQFRWGGYFGGGKGKYGALDTMHFDLAGDKVGMGGGSWANGLTSSQAALWPGVSSQGMSDAAQAIDKLTTASTDASKGLSGIGQILGGSAQQNTIASALPSATTPAAGTSALTQVTSGLGDMLNSIVSGLSGFLSKIIGGAGSGLGSLFSGVLSIFGLADGGHVSGPGTSRSDSIPAMLSNGEFVVNAAQTKKYRPMLEAINSGAMLHRADGGIVAPRVVPAPVAPRLRSRSAASNDNGGNPGTLNVHINGASGDAHIKTLVEQGVSSGLSNYNVQQQRGGFGTLQTQYQNRKS